MTECRYKLIEGDSGDVLRTFAGESIDLTVTSPPYDNYRTYQGFVFDFEPIAGELFRVTKQGGVVVWVVGDSTINGSESGTSFRQALKFMDIGFKLHDTMIYQKDSISFPDSIRYHQIFEYMFVFSKGKPSAVNLLRDRANLGYNGKKHIKGSWRNADGSMTRHSKQNLLQSHGVRYNIWRISGGHQKSTNDKIAFNHPAIFPEKLAEDHILSWSNAGDTVLDPFCGSGTTGKMAVINDRKFIGIDVSGEYLDTIARPRIESVLNAAPLFAQ